MRERLRRLYSRIVSGEVARVGARGLRLAGRDALEYRNGDRSVVIETELLTGPVDRVVYAGLITRWLPPHDNEAISAEERSEIVQFVRNYLEATGRKVDVDWDPPAGGRRPLG